MSGVINKFYSGEIEGFYEESAKLLKLNLFLPITGLIKGDTDFALNASCSASSSSKVFFRFGGDICSLTSI